MTAIASLARFVGRSREPGDTARHRCELCGAEMGEPHQHVVDVEARTLCCSCAPCALLFASGAGRFRTVPGRVLADPGLALTAKRWAERTGIPVQLVFVFFNSAQDRWVATFPSPAGPTEAELEAGAIERLEPLSPLFSAVEPDVEALLVRRPAGAPELVCYLVPIDLCYRLVGEVRRLWSGFFGGDPAQNAIDVLFSEVARRSRPIAGDGGNR